MSARISKGDTVRCTHGEPDSGLFVGRNYEAKEVYVRSATGDAYIDVGVDPDGWRAERFEKVEPEHAGPEDKADLYVEPEPLKAGDDVLVWATVDHVRGERIGLHFEDDTNDDFATASADAIVRPGAGQVPPWVKAEQDEAKAIRAIKTALVVDGGMHDDRYTQQTAESLYRAGIRATKGGAS